jgi:hypothetical protein
MSKKHVLVVRETITREWEIAVDAESLVQVESWWLEGNIPLQESSKCEVIDEHQETEILNIIELP